MKTYYFDYNATTPVDREVLTSMEPFLTENFGNPSSIHHMGKVPARALREARVQVAAFLGAASEKEIVFTSGGTESNNTAVRSALKARPGKKRVIISAVEHSSIRKLAKVLEQEGCEIVKVGVDADGQLNLDELEKNLTKDTAIVSIMMANNETGVIFPVEKIGELVRSRGILFHVDGVQAAGKLPLEVAKWPLDFFSVSSHKIYGPKGAGALYVRSQETYFPLIAGGAQERGRRAGTENVAGIAGFAKACQLAGQRLDADAEHLRTVREEFESRLTAAHEDITVNAGRSQRLPNTSNLHFSGVDGEALLFAMDQKGICASSGSACMSGSRAPSHVLLAMGLSEEAANASVRFSFGRWTAESDVQEASKIILEIFTHLRSFSTDFPHTHDEETAAIVPAKEKVS